MALKLLKVQITLEVKADSSDSEDVKERVYEALQVLMESEELDYQLDLEDSEEEYEGEE